MILRESRARHEQLERISKMKVIIHDLTHSSYPFPISPVYIYACIVCVYIYIYIYIYMYIYIYILCMSD